ncbi:PAAR domain-containing protein [Sodalis ligni]|uniref:Putative Zn-binding protein involved in type VI secretion n=1 Tax=Sodalis ligni TaxID=2697027 RepID=A0A4R1NIB0_9GAMM|nr:PAAR domain-containing protein [Sodalis ligni]TCL05611.1 putative Zn-binding protein involved in type VI secretion [Sodalis ligni]
MKGIIRIGDKTTHGGTVTSGSQVMKFGGIGVARKGDDVACPKHGGTSISEGHTTFCDNSFPVAFHGHRCACGCRLLSSLPHVTES